MLLREEKASPCRNFKQRFLRKDLIIKQQESSKNIISLKTMPSVMEQGTYIEKNIICEVLSVLVFTTLDPQILSLLLNEAVELQNVADEIQTGGQGAFELIGARG